MKLFLTIHLLLLTICLHSQSEIILQPGPDEGKDARIQSNIPDQNIATTQFYSDQSGTMSGVPFLDRSLISFDVLSSLPPNALIISASLSLYANTLNGGHTQVDGSNQSVLELITEPWEEETVTWNNQPATDGNINAVLNETNGFDQNYLSIDVMPIVESMLSNPSSEYEMMLKLTDESGRKTMQFASSNAPDAALHPKLTICYDMSTATEEAASSSDEISLYPNPFTDQLTIKLVNPEPSQVIIYNQHGQALRQFMLVEKVTRLNIDELPEGTYFVSIINNEIIATKKLVKL